MALLLGAFAFSLFYFLLPAWIASLISERQNSTFYPMLQTLLARRVHWLQWVGIACGLVGLFFAFRNYYFGNTAGRGERSVVSLLARLLGRSLD
jgi:drug/metabolite transporter (DMT)-like permease